jgi:hypothetical protein
VRKNGKNSWEKGWNCWKLLEIAGKTAKNS